MRYANTQLKKLLERNYKKQKWYEQFKNEIALVVIILMLTFSFWFLLGEIKEIVGSLNPLLDSASAVVEAAEKLLGAVDNVQSGSGIRPA